jgi:hypothetical protein
MLRAAWICLLLDVSSEPAVDYWPHDRVLTYRVSDGRRVEHRYAGDGVFESFRFFVQGKTRLTVSKTRDRVALLGMANHDYAYRFDPGVVVQRRVMRVGAGWTQRIDAVCDGVRYPMDVSVQVLRAEKIVVPAGPFECRVVRTRWEIRQSQWSSEETAWFASRVGAVKHVVVREQFGTRSTQTAELISLEPRR